MSLKWPLFWWQARQIGGITVVALILALVYTLHEANVLRFSMRCIAPYFILVHSLLIAWRLGRTQHRTFGFLYTQGYARNALWLHTMLAGAASVLVVWLPTAIAVWSGLRGRYQAGLENRWFPLMAEAERPYVLWCLLSYAVLLPVFHYAWIRGSQACRGSITGILLAMCVVVTALSIWNAVQVPLMPVWTQWLMAGGMVIAAVSLLIGGRRLHRSTEVMT